MGLKNFVQNGTARQRATYLITDLGQFDFGRDNGRLRSTTYHEGITPEKIKAKTGFELTVADTLSGARRRKKLLEIMNCKL